MTNLMERVLKRDPDAELVQDNGGQLYLNTTEDVNELAPELVQRDLPPLLDDQLLQNAAAQRMMDVDVQLMYVVFAVASIVYFACAMLAAALYWMLDLDETHHVTVVVTAIAASAAGIFYIAMAIAVSRKAPTPAVVFLILWSFFFILVIGCISALLRIIAPIQLMLMGWMQAMSVVIYANRSRTHINPQWAAVWMTMATAVVWGVGIYAFVVEHDWIASSVILVLGLAMVMYNTFEIKATMERNFSITYKHKVEASARYWVDPLLGLVWLVIWPFKRWCCNGTPTQMIPMNMEEGETQ